MNDEELSVYVMLCYSHIFALSELSCVLVTNENMGLCLYMNVPTYLIARNVHGPCFTSPQISGQPGSTLNMD